MGTGTPGIFKLNIKLLFGHVTFIEQNTVAWNKCFEMCGGVELLKNVTPTSPYVPVNSFSKMFACYSTDVSQD